MTRSGSVAYKICARCKEHVRTTEFTRTDGKLNSYCRPCSNEIAHERYFALHRQTTNRKK